MEPDPNPTEYEEWEAEQDAEFNELMRELANENE
jgi:hypothetical protein